MNAPTLFHCDWLATQADRMPIRDAIQRIRFNDQPYSIPAWIEALESAVQETGNPEPYTTLIGKVQALQGMAQ